MTQNAKTSSPKTIVLIHGLWMTALSWENWVSHYTNKGYRVIAESWPGLGGDIHELRRDPTPIAGLGITEIVDFYEGIINKLDEAPIIMGHSFGGLMTQILLDRGLGAAGVTFGSAAVKGVLLLPLSTIRVVTPALSNPLNNHRAVPLTPDQFHYAFMNEMSDEESRQVFEKFAVPGPDHLLFQAGLANFNPNAASTVDVQNNNRAPLLMIAGEKDHISPPSIVKSNTKLYHKSSVVTDYKEFAGRTHFMCGWEGWQEIADYSLDWAVKHAAPVTAV